MSSNVPPPLRANRDLAQYFRSVNAFVDRRWQGNWPRDDADIATAVRRALRDDDVKALAMDLQYHGQWLFAVGKELARLPDRKSAR